MKDFKERLAAVARALSYVQTRRTEKLKGTSQDAKKARTDEPDDLLRAK